jgi:hypothetical protein
VVATAKVLALKGFVPAMPAAQALREGAGTRLDGRTPYEYRKAKLQVKRAGIVCLCIERLFACSRVSSADPAHLVFHTLSTSSTCSQATWWYMVCVSGKAID